MICNVKFSTGTLSSFFWKVINFPRSSNKLYSKFKRSCKFVVINPKVKWLLDIGSSSELLNGTLTYFFLPFNLSQLSIWLMFTMPSVFMLFPFTMVSFASVKPLQLTNITFVSFVKEELNNKLFIIKRYLLCVNLERKVLILLSFMLISTDSIFRICRRFVSQRLLLHLLFSLHFFFYQFYLFIYLFIFEDNRIEKLAIFLSFMSIFWCLLMSSS